MRRKIVLYIAMSLDGYIARKDGTLDWLPDPGDIDMGYDDFYDTIDTVVMGAATYEQIINELSPDVWPYEGKQCFVATTKNRTSDKRTTFISEDIAGFVSKLKQQPGKDIWLVGGGKLVDPFIKQNVIDQYIITVMPTILGDGIPLFLGTDSKGAATNHTAYIPTETKLRLAKTKTFGNIIELCYIRD